MQNLKREALAKAIALPAEMGALIAKMRQSDGLCTCGRYLSSLDAKFILANPIPTKGVVVVAAYCFSCFSIINGALGRCKNQAYTQKRSEAELRG